MGSYKCSIFIDFLLSCYGVIEENIATEEALHFYEKLFLFFQAGAHPASFTEGAQDLIERYLRGEV